MVKRGQFVPDSERRLWQTGVQQSLERAGGHAAAHQADGEWRARSDKALFSRSGKVCAYGPA